MSSLTRLFCSARSWSPSYTVTSGQKVKGDMKNPEHTECQLLDTALCGLREEEVDKHYLKH
jgi:hypothetical protein